MRALTPEQRFELSLLYSRRGDDGLGAAVDVELLQDRRVVRLHRRLRDRKLIGDLLVHQPVAQHHQHADLLRGERREPAHEGRLLIVLGETDALRHEDFAAQHGVDGAADIGRADGFGQIT
jgi:hypothetical protein